jgi:hypothetical protein
MRELGNPIEWRKVVRATISEMMDELKHPRVAGQKLARALMGKY